MHSPLCARHCTPLSGIWVWMWTQNPSQHSDPGHYSQSLGSQHQRWNLFIMNVVLIPSSHFTNAKTEAQKEKVTCPRSYSKTVGKVGLLGTHKSTSFYISREETQLTWNITRTRKKFKFHHDHEKSAHLDTQWNPARKFLSPPQRRRHECSEVRGSSMPRAESKGGGGVVADNGGVFKLCFSNETNHWLFIF